MFNWPICLPALLALPFIFFPAQAVERSFKIDYEQNTFLKDGRPYRYISGEIHYFRDRLYRVRAAGLNAVQVYIPWNFHEEKPTSFNFDGDRNITKFLQLAQQNELDVLLRIGPYVCAELEFGGIPWWLIKDQADIVLRTSNHNYLLNVERYFDVLLPILKPLLYQNGGPIIMLQIENEYGSVLCDHTYTKWLRDLVRSRLGNDVVLYTTDGFNDWMVTCGAVEGTFPTVDFGAPQTELSVKNHFMVQQKHSGGGPNVNSEFYTTWFSMWGDKAIFKQQIPAVLNAIEIMWNQNASFSFYMIHGGTNFGFWSGMERDGPVITSYDYSAPISEEGQITPLYEAIRTWIGQKPDWPNPPLALPPNRTGLAIDNVVAVRLGNFIRLLNSTVGRSHQCLTSKGRPINFEQFNEDHTFVWYSATLDVGGALLQIPELRDHAFVFLDGQFKGNLSVCDRSGCVRNLTLNGKAGQRLDLLVENAGRLTYPLTKVDPKGILSPVLLDGKPVGQTWLQCGVDIGALYSVAKLQFESRLLAGSSIDDEPPPSPNEPAIYVAKFNTAGIDWSQMHTFFDSRGWGYGVALVNGFNLGRYWPLLGPQMTLFVPGAVMHNENIVVLLELAGKQKSDNNIKFVASPVYSGVEYFDFSTAATEEVPERRSTAAGGHLRKQQIAWDLRRRRLQDEPSIVARRARQSNQRSWHVEEKHHHHLVEMEDIIF